VKANPNLPGNLLGLPELEAEDWEESEYFTRRPGHFHAAASHQANVAAGGEGVASLWAQAAAVQQAFPGYMPVPQQQHLFNEEEAALGEPDWLDGGGPDDSLEEYDSDPEKFDDPFFDEEEGLFRERRGDDEEEEHGWPLDRRPPRSHAPPTWGNNFGNAGW